MTVKQYCIYLCRCTQEAAAGQQGMPEAPVADEVALRVCRQGRVLAVTVRLAHEDGMGTSRLVHWCGAQIQVRAPLVTRAALVACTDCARCGVHVCHQSSSQVQGPCPQHAHHVVRKCQMLESAQAQLRIRVALVRLGVLGI